MYPTTFHPQEQVISPPKGQHEEISGLRVLPVVYSDGSQALISCWCLTPAELELVQKTGRVYLAVMAIAQPPVLLAVDPVDVGLHEV